MIAYVDPIGVDAGDCNRAAPCRSAPFAISKTTDVRNHVVLANASYALDRAFIVGPDLTPASSLTLHGGGASMTKDNGDMLFESRVPITIRDLTFRQQNGAPISIHAPTGPSIFERVRIEGVSGLSVASTLTLRDVVLEGISPVADRAGLIVAGGAVLDLERTTVRGWDVCIASSYATLSSQLTMRNSLVFDCTKHAMAMDKTAGLVEFSTIARSGANTLQGGANAVSCVTSTLTFRASIVWAPGITSQPPLQGCNVVNSIVGPIAIPGAINSDPLFIDAAAGKFGLKAGSPARDAATMGPLTDVVKNARPQGTAYDLGAYEGP
ncbi:MAG TPA: choice-of-anchor Q domain-containing protein [Kofleriaceae bacterium]|nr:choice-of-anchor Q domain-containing protein [Kofleriaceae bacterium]